MDSREAESNIPGLYKTPKGWGTRHTLVLLGFWSFIFNYAMRFNMSIAIVSMVRHQHHSHSHSHGADINHALREKESFCGDVLRNSSGSGQAAMGTGRRNRGEFEWTLVEQGFILGSFFWGYVIAGLPGGLLSKRYGGKWVVSIGLLVTAILTILIPLSARLGIAYITTVRILQGIAEGVTVPAMQTILSKWMPPTERGLMTTTVFSGVSAGTALTMVVSGYLIENFGWPSVFYGIGGMTFIWFALWTFLVYSSPSSHPRISLAEAHFIKNSIGDQHSAHNVAVPWKSILTSVPVMAIYVAHMAHSWGMYTLFSEIPTYMKTALNFDMKQNKWASASPFVVKLFLGIGITHIGDMLIRKKMCSITLARKLCNTVAQWGSGICLVVVAYSGCNVEVTLVFLNLSLGLLGGAMGGFLVNTIDLSPNHAGVIMGIDHAISNIWGFVAPYAAGHLLSGNPSLEHWRNVFLVSAAIFFVGNLVYIIFGSSQEAPWNREPLTITEVSKLSKSDDALNLRNRRSSILEDL